MGKPKIFPGPVRACGKLSDLKKGTLTETARRSPRLDGTINGTEEFIFCAGWKGRASINSVPIGNTNCRIVVFFDVTFRHAFQEDERGLLAQGENWIRPKPEQEVDENGESSEDVFYKFLIRRPKRRKSEEGYIDVRADRTCKMTLDVHIDVSHHYFVPGDKSCINVNHYDMESFAANHRRSSHQHGKRQFAIALNSGLN